MYIKSILAKLPPVPASHGAVVWEPKKRKKDEGKEIQFAYTIFVDINEGHVFPYSVAEAGVSSLSLVFQLVLPQSNNSFLHFHKPFSLVPRRLGNVEGRQEVASRREEARRGRR
jgi:hypothetical protein